MTEKSVSIKGKQFFVKKGELTLENQNISDISEIEGLGTLTDLKFLYLPKNHITSIHSLEKLKNLESLSLDGNKVEKIEGLSTLKKLTWLNLANNQINIIEGLEELKNLQTLFLMGNQFQKIQGLENLGKLTILFLDDNQIESISGLEKLTHLKEIRLSKNRIREFSNLDNSKELEILRLSDNQISAINGLSTFKQLKVLDAANNQLTQIPNLSGLPKFMGLILNSNKISDMAGLGVLDRMSTIQLANNCISNITGLASLNSLFEIDLSNNNITDPSPLRSVKGLSKALLDGNPLSDLAKDGFARNEEYTKEQENKRLRSELRMSLNIDHESNASRLKKSGMTYINQGRPVEARYSFLQALKLDPNDFEAYMGLIQAQSRWKNAINNDYFKKYKDIIFISLEEATPLIPKQELDALQEFEFLAGYPLHIEVQPAHKVACWEGAYIEGGHVRTLMLQLYNLKKTPKGLPKIPESVGHLTYLEDLILEKTNVAEVPSTIQNCKSLSHLQIANSNLKELPDEIKYLTNLNVLILNSNQFSEIPYQIYSLTNLKLINLQWNPYNNDDFIVVNSAISFGTNDVSSINTEIGVCFLLRYCRIRYSEKSSTPLLDINEPPIWSNFDKIYLNPGEYFDWYFAHEISLGMMGNLWNLAMALTNKGDIANLEKLVNLYNLEKFKDILNKMKNGVRFNLWEIDSEKTKPTINSQ